MIRWKGVIFLAALALLIFLASLVLTDAWLERNMEAYGTSLAGSRVEFDGVRFSLTDLRLEWQRLQVTDPRETMTNLLETGSCDMNVMLMPLLQKKVVVENVALTGLRINTARERDGALSEAEQAALPELPDFIVQLRDGMAAEAAEMPLLNLSRFTRKLNADSLYALLDLQSPGRIDSLKRHAEKRIDDWEERLAQLPDAQTFDNLQGRIRALDPQQVKDVTALKKALETADNIKKELDATRDNVRRIKSDLSTDMSAVGALPAQAGQWVEGDIRRALQKAQLPDLSMGNIARMLFGPQILERLSSITAYIGRVRYYSERVQDLQPEKVDVPRLSGQYIYFGTPNTFPKYWIQKVDVSGITPDGLELGGLISDIVSDQKHIGKPLNIALRGGKAGATALTLNGIFDYLEDLPKENLKLDLKNVSLAGTRLSDFPLIPSRIKEGIGDLNLDLQLRGGSFLSNIDFIGKQIRFDQQVREGLSGRLAEISRSVTGAISEIRFQAAARQLEKKFDLNLSSNLDRLIGGELQNLLGAELRETREALTTRIRRTVDGPRQQLEAQISARTTAATETLGQAEKKIQSTETLLADTRKAIEQKISEAGKGLLKGLIPGKK